MKINIKEILGEQDEKPVSGGEETEVIQEKTEAPEEEDSREEKAPEVILQEEREMPEEASEAVGEEEETEETTEAEEEPGQEEPEAETERSPRGKPRKILGRPLKKSLRARLNRSLKSRMSRSLRARPAGKPKASLRRKRQIRAWTESSF